MHHRVDNRIDECILEHTVMQQSLPVRQSVEDRVAECAPLGVGDVEQRQHRNQRQDNEADEIGGYESNAMDEITTGNGLFGQLTFGDRLACLA